MNTTLPPMVKLLNAPDINERKIIAHTVAKKLLVFCAIILFSAGYAFGKAANAAPASSPATGLEVSSVTAPLQPKSFGQADTSQFQKPGRLKRAKKIKKDKDDEEDGVDDDIRARGRQEFLQQRDPKLNRVPLERLLTARKMRDQFLNNVKVRKIN